MHSIFLALFFLPTGLNWVYLGIIPFGVHAVWITTNVLQHCPEGRMIPRFYVDGMRKSVTVNVTWWMNQACVMSVQKRKVFFFLKCHSWLKNLRCKLVQYFENLHFIENWKLHFDTSVDFFLNNYSNSKMFICGKPLKLFPFLYVLVQLKFAYDIFSPLSSMI